MNTIQLNRSDDCFERARKILQCAGVFDGAGIAPKMAEAIEKYKQMDRSFLESEEVENMRSAMNITYECLKGLEDSVSGNSGLFLKMAKEQLEPYIE